MENLRYGKFQFSDYYSAWMGILFLLIVGIVGFCLDVWSLLCFYAIFLALLMLWSIIIPNTEHFTILDNTLMTRRGNKRRDIIIPEELTLILSCADVCPLFAKRVSIGNQTYMLKDRYAVSILRKMPLESALDCLHRNRVRKYTTSTIEECFDDHYYVYSFVCNQFLLKKLTTNKEYLLIIPESLVDRVPIDSDIANKYVDIGY